jgi:hypothetical protein
MATPPNLILEANNALMYFLLYNKPHAFASMVTSACLPTLTHCWARINVLHPPQKFERPQFWNGWSYAIKNISSTQFHHLSLAVECCLGVQNSTWIVKVLKDDYTLRDCFNVLRELWTELNLWIFESYKDPSLMESTSNSVILLQYFIYLLLT